MIDIDRDPRLLLLGLLVATSIFFIPPSLPLVIVQGPGMQVNRFLISRSIKGHSALDSREEVAF